DGAPHPYVTQRRVARLPGRRLLWPGLALPTSDADRPTHMLLRPKDSYRVVYATLRSTFHKPAWNRTSWLFPRARRRCLVRCLTLPRTARARLLCRHDHAVRCLRAKVDQQATEEADGSPLRVKAPFALLAVPLRR